MDIILVIDAGTTAFKAVLFNKEMRIISTASREFEVRHPEAHRLELDPEAYWLSCAAAVREALAGVSLDPQHVAAVAVTSHTDTLFVLDDSGNALTNAILWTDPRAQGQADRIKQKIGIERIYQATGQTDALAIHFASRLAWFIENNSKASELARHYLQTQDYLIFRLTGQAVMDHSVSCTSLLGYLERKEYWPEMLDLVGVDVDRLSRIIAPGEVAGPLSSSAAGVLGLQSGVPVIAAAMDQTAAAIAMDNVRTGVISEMTGAVMAIAATCDEPKLDKSIRIPCLSHAVQGKYLLLPWCATAGSALKWYRDQFFLPWYKKDEKGTSNLYDIITAEAAEVSSGSDGVILLPYFAGSGSPEFIANAKAVIFGLTLAHSRKHISRAFLESVAFMLKQNLDLLAPMGIQADCIRSSGGGSRSPLWCQIKADVTGIPIVVDNLHEATATGAAKLASVRLGWQLDFDAGNREDDTATVFEPNSAACSLYQDAYERFVRLGNALAEMFE